MYNFSKTVLNFWKENEEVKLFIIQEKIETIQLLKDGTCNVSMD